MILAKVLEYGLVLLILALCGVFLWRRFRGTMRGENTTCGCERPTCGGRGGAPSCPADINAGSELPNSETEN